VIMLVSIGGCWPWRNEGGRDGGTDNMIEVELPEVVIFGEPNGGPSGPVVVIETMRTK